MAQALQTGNIFPNPALDSADITGLIATASQIAAGTAGRLVDAAGFVGAAAVNTVNAAGAAETLDTSLYACHDVTLDSDPCVFTFSNPYATGRLCSFMLILRQDVAGTNGVTWPGSVIWENGVEPVLVETGGNVSVLQFWTIDGGTTWFGTVTGDSFA